MRYTELYESQETIIDKIKTECSQIIQIYNDLQTSDMLGNKIFRGVKPKDPMVNLIPVDGHTSRFLFKAAIRTDRRPLTTSLRLYQALLHKAFLNIGLETTRMNGLFTSADSGMAETWDLFI